MARQPGGFDLDLRLLGLSRKGDALEPLAEVGDVELFRPPFDHVLMAKVLVLQTQNGPADAGTEFHLRDRLARLRFLGLGLGDAVPDANAIWAFREALTTAGAIARLFERFDQAPREAGWLAMSGQLLDATIVSAPRQRTTKAEKQAIKAGRVPRAWKENPAKLRQKDRDASPVGLLAAAISWLDDPACCQNHVGADRRHRLIRTWQVTDAAAYAGARLADLLDPANTASGVWADSAYRGKKNETLLKQPMLTSHTHRKKPKGRAVPERTAAANAKGSAVRAHVEHV